MLNPDLVTNPPPHIAKPLLWSTFSSLGTQALSFLTFAILARLLGAPAFGLVALAALVIDLFLIVSSVGIGEAVVQRKVLNDVEADTAFWINLGSGLVFCSITVATAPLIAGLFGQPQLQPIVTALAAIFAITPLGAIHSARLTRALQFKSIALRNIAASIAGAAVGLPLALAGCGVWALVGQRIAAACATVIFVWASSRWYPRMRFEWRTCSQLIRFGGYIGLSGTLNQINIRSTEIISGALVGPLAVAFIRAGSRIAEVISQITYTPFQQIAMPLLARTAADRDALKETYLKLSRLSAFIMFPTFMGIFAVAPQIVALIFGPDWALVADAIRIFTCAVVASQINNLIIAALASVGESRTVLSWTTVQIVLGGTAAVAVHRWGWQAMLIAGVLRGYLIIPYGFFLLRKYVGVSLREVARTLRPALTSTALMVLVLLTGIRGCPPPWTDLAVMIVWLPVGIALYLCSYICQDRKTIEQIMTIYRLYFLNKNLRRER
ncbi:lipopolysaccharide biosynthesis protein [Novosphingobium resinovorum]|uniref:lipopolysaccharide biosynthesis protein n=1 Tax=Novosphingobium resinovorum TaxID=158500 RepID=UPI002ED45A09|nr:lipopolysaccharide biosynthesis protein [Novosphingobium resinovorum]